MPTIIDFGVAQPGLSVSWEGSILWDAGSDTQGWLVYGYSPDWDAPQPRLGRASALMVGRRLTLSAP